MIFNRNKHSDTKDDLVKIAALLIHAAKIDENYSLEEKEIIKKTLLEFHDEGKNYSLCRKTQIYIYHIFFLALKIPY